MVFDKSVSDPANITISEDFDFYIGCLIGLCLKTVITLYLEGVKPAVLTFVILMAKAKRISRTRNLNYQGVSVL